jgi:hypothetical protein
MMTNGTQKVWTDSESGTQKKSSDDHNQFIDPKTGDPITTIVVPEPLLSDPPSEECMKALEPC